MADTQRSISTLTGTTFVDGQSAGEITAQDDRDMIVSLAYPHGHIYKSSGSGSTAIAIANTFYVLDTTNVVTTSTHLRNCTSPSNGRITYTGAAACIAYAHATISCDCGTATQSIRFRFAINGTSQAATQQMHTSNTTASRPNTVSISGLLSLTTNDYVEVFVTNATATNAVVVDYLNFTLIGFVT